VPIVSPSIHPAAGASARQVARNVATAQMVAWMWRGIGGIAAAISIRSNRV
jgi:hypothetical protein